MISFRPYPGIWGPVGPFLGCPPGVLCVEATRASNKMSEHLSSVQAKQPDNPGIRTDQGVILPDILARVPAPPGPRDGPRFPIDTDQIAQDIAFGRQIEDDPWIHAMFLIMPPDTVAEVLGIPLQAPCTIQDALAAVEQVRDEANSGMYPELFVAEPQPSRLFACLLAAPAWAQHLCTILADTRSLNGALFAVATSSRLNRESLLLAAGLPVSDQVQVFCGTSLQPLAPWQLADLISGMTVTFYPVHLPAPRRALLEDMLQSTLLWDPDADIPSPAGIYFLLLTDGMPALFALQPQRGSYHREDISQALQCDEHNLTIQQSLPRQQDALFKGHHVRAVCVATTAISRIPVPPGRLLPPSYTCCSSIAARFSCPFSGFCFLRRKSLYKAWLTAMMTFAPKASLFQSQVLRLRTVTQVPSLNCAMPSSCVLSLFRITLATLTAANPLALGLSAPTMMLIFPMHLLQTCALEDPPPTEAGLPGYHPRKTRSQVPLGPTIQLRFPWSRLTCSVCRVPRLAVSFL